MPGYIGEIPGMYYDTKNEKYFAIQANYAAPANSAYSSQDVKRRMLRDEKEAAATKKEEHQECRIRQARILQEPLTGGSLSRETGLDGFDPAQILAGGLVRRGHHTIIVSPIEDVGSGMFSIGHKPAVGPSIFELRHAINGYIELYQFDLQERDFSSQDFGLDFQRYGDDRIPGLPSTTEITSVCVHETSGTLATTWLGCAADYGIMLSSTSIEDVNDQPSQNRRQVVLGPGLSRGSDVCIFSSTPAPPQANLIFAYGTSAGVLATDKHGSYDTYFITLAPSKDQPDDTFAIEFLSDNPSVLLSGGRRGILGITDLRLPMSSPNSDTITHPSSITHICQLDQHRLIVSGLNSTLCQYDLRFRKTRNLKPIPEQKAKAKSRLNFHPTSPILVYPDYQNTASHQAGFDIDLEAGIVAAAQEADEFTPAIQLFSLHGGHKLDSPHANGFQAKDDDDWLVKCLRFARDTDSGMKSLYVGHRKKIQRYAWGDVDDG
ncbi:hypothetical protein BKA64DRAFT_660795 [Cadophora sp. MPI-SDFR-AT-0126]|nr:hypothetical protein BKA64DRAFT_660795 [Leotiomycetes sp. MPI-SDFR-AT-0126]